jgi:hypothetical protein
MQQDESAAEAEHIVVVGAGPAGLAVSLGLYRYSIHGSTHAFDCPHALSLRQKTTLRIARSKDSIAANTDMIGEFCVVQERGWERSA